MTPGELKTIEDRANAATPGQWDLIGDDEIGIGVEKIGVGHSYDVALAQVTTESDRLDDLTHNPNQFRIKLGTVKADADFIAHARADVPALLTEIRELQAELIKANAAAMQIAQGGGAS
jgi:hypothetical protein